MRSPSRYVDIDFLLEKGNFMDAGSLNASVSLEWRVEGMALCVCGFLYISVAVYDSLTVDTRGWGGVCVGLSVVVGFGLRSV